MSYQVLARKWRPGKFSEVAGQGHVLKSLINALDNNRLHHAYLFTGTRGVGKTTLARILAKCLNCEQGVSSTPCNECASCTEISEGRFIDLIEVDAASRTKVEDTRDLLENVQYSPSRGRFKVYLIDEVHMLSNHSFNALLKTLEEPPEHVKFLFATTDPQKLPVTILSRCLQFNLKNLSPRIIVEQLMHILEQEGISYDEAALWQLASAASGSMRDALTLADQAIAYCQGSVSEKGTIEMLGIPAQQQVVSLIESMASADVQEALQVVAAIAESASDFLQTLDALLAKLHRIALAQAVPEAVDNSLGDKATITALAEKISAEDIQLVYQMGLKGRADVQFAQDPQVAFEMLVLRMMLFAPGLVHRRESGEQDGASPKKTATNGSGTEPEKKKPLSQIEQEDQPENRQVSTRAGNPEAKSPAHPAASLSSHAEWLEFFASMQLTGIPANVLASCVLTKREGDTLHFNLDSSQSAVYNAELLPRLERLISEQLGERVRISLSVEETGQETPGDMLRRHKKEEHEKLVESFAQDELVQSLLSTFSASVDSSSVKKIEDLGNDRH